MPDTDQLRLQMREAALGIFIRALQASTVEQAFARHVDCDRGVLRIGEDLHDLDSYSRIFVVSFGKAAHSMLHALQSRTGDRLEGIVATSTLLDLHSRGFRYFQSGHPTPNAESLRAAEATLKSLAALNSSSLVIYLISGGGSSMLEKPCDEEISLEDLIATYRALVLSGAPIAEINAIRKHLSAVKGGRLAQAAYPAQQVSLLVSDVPASTPDALASGPTMPDPTTAEDCYAIAKKYNLLNQVPGSVSELFSHRALEETPKSHDPAFIRSRWWTVLSNASIEEAARAEAECQGFNVTVDDTCDDWDYARAADYLLHRLRELRKQSERVCLISGGEITVKVSGQGLGGRNQHFVLTCAGKIQGEAITVLSAGTDGIDGNSPAAGAVVDGTTCERARRSDCDAQTSLAAFDSHSFFHHLGDAVITGPTGNNLRDLRVLLAY
jgi:glycerate 2-kinase